MRQLLPTFKQWTVNNLNEAKNLFWKAHIFGKLPCEIIRDYTEFEEFVDNTILDLGWEDFVKLHGMEIK